MKCENCGNHEANYHYTSNINGKVTERHLCSECAGKLGFENDLFTDVDNMFENMLGGFFGKRSLLGSFDPFGGSMLRLPTLLMPRIEIRLENEDKKAEDAAVDPELKKAREINALKEKMKQAAEEENFEKAAEIRDQIRALEAPEKNGKPAE